MADQPTRTLREAAAAANIDLSPDYITADEQEKIAQSGEVLVCESCSAKSVEGLPDVYEFVMRRADGRRFITSMWDNARREGNAVALMQLTQDGPVGGVVIINAGTKAKPFYIVQAA